MKVALILAGSGVFDGSEINEAVLTMLYLDQANIAYQCMAPNIAQHHVINHLNGEEMQESRNVLTEAARICRGDIVDLASQNPNDYAAVIVPGGFGVAKNLSDFAFKGSECTVQTDVLNFLQGMQQRKKPVGLMCIAPAIAQRVFGDGVLCTVGDDESVASAIEQMGGVHKNCSVEQTCFDEAQNLVTTPAYMLAGSVGEAAKGIERLVQDIVKLLK